MKPQCLVVSSAGQALLAVAPDAQFIDFIPEPRLISQVYVVGGGDCLAENGVVVIAVFLLF